MSVQSGQRLHQRGAQGTSTHVMENAVRITEKLKREIRDTYSMKANILGLTACAMAMQINLSEQWNKSKGHRHPSHGGAVILPALQKEIKEAMDPTFKPVLMFNGQGERDPCASNNMLQHRQCRRWRDIQAKHLLRNAGNRYLDWINHVSGQWAELSRASTRRSSGRKIGTNAEHCNRPKQNPRCGCTIPGMWCSRRERTTSQGPLTEIQCARLAWHYITRQRKRS